jgi:HK97 gp10 family phage protein
MPMTVIKNDLERIAVAMQTRCDQALLETAVWIADEAKARMSDPKSGRMYKVSATGELHQASAPGQAPAIDTGNLAGGIEAQADGRGKAVAYATAEYAAGLEFGTRKMAARPFFTPTAFKAVEFLWERMRRALRGE